MNKINNELIEDADDLDIVMPMYNLLEYSINYRKPIGSFYNYYRDELSDYNILINFINIKVVNSDAFNYKNKIIGNTYNVDSTIPNPDAAVAAAANPRVVNPDYEAEKLGKKNLELAIPLKHLGNFWRALNMPLISCEISLELKWNKNCVITSLQQGVALDGGKNVEPTGATFNIKLYIFNINLRHLI